MVNQKVHIPTLLKTLCNLVNLFETLTVPGMSEMDFSKSIPKKNLAKCRLDKTTCKTITRLNTMSCQSFAVPAISLAKIVCVCVFKSLWKRGLTGLC